MPRDAWRAHVASTELAAMTLTRIKRHHVVRWLRDLAAKEPRLAHLVQGTWGRVWSLPEVRDWLGHGSIKMTERYAHLRPGGLHDAAAMTSGAMVAPTMANVIDIGGK